MQKRTRVAIITPGDLEDRKNWSGIPHFIYKALQQHFDEVVPLGPYKSELFLSRAVNSLNYRLSRKLDSTLMALFKQRYLYDQNIVLSKLYSVYFDRQLQEKGPFDLIIAPSAHIAVWLLKSKVPVFIITDATLYLLTGYYDFFSNLSKISKNEIHMIERKGFEKATYGIFSSQWAADSAINDYKIDTDKIKVIPFGANIETEPLRQDIFRQDFSYKLLFLGVDWGRKGGAIAFECLTELVNAGINVKLTICGCVPPEEFRHENLEVIPFLDKNDPAGYSRLIGLMKEADFMLMPTRADCTPVVFCEASAYGTPSITTDTGGVGAVVEDGINGFKLSFEAQGKDYAELIANIYADKPAYRRLSKSTREKYENELNWGAWGANVKELFLAM